MERKMIQSKEYYEKRRLEMLRLREEEGLTDKEIGDRFGGLSRERVRQVLGNKGRFFRKEWTQKLVSSGKIRFAHREDVDNAPGVKREWLRDWGKERHEARGGYVEIGQKFEEMASVILARHGIDNMLMPVHCGYNVETANGAKIDVVSSTFDVSKIKSQTKSIYPTFAVPVRRRNKWDFLFAFIPDKEQFTYYVIPSYALEHLSNGSDGRIRIPHPTMSQKASKWHRYHKRIDLIQNYTV